MPEPKIRSAYLDGLRGLAALYVVFYHVYREINWQLKLSMPSLVSTLMECLNHGRFAVAVFIVLSGYCLMLPMVNSANRHGSLLNYFKRRARRILPPYYAALVLSLLLFALIPASLHSAMGLHWNEAQPAFTPGVLLSHVLLLHNLKEDWIYKINGPMWSVATEWQIYFFFPLLLLPVWKRFGLPSTLATAFAVGLAPHYLIYNPAVGKYKYLDWAVPWYLGLFALGMAGAVIGFSRQPSFIFLRKRLPWHVLCLGLITLLAVQRDLWKNDHAWTVDVLVGAIVAAMLIYCTSFLTTTDNRQQPILILQLLGSQWAVALGSFSYSLYLVHAPILGVSQLLVDSLDMPPMVQVLTLLMVVPLAVILSYLFHLAFERPFMHNYPKKEKAA